jgi:ubiquitin carboxyl-terminal hydrolase 4/11/15
LFIIQLGRFTQDRTTKNDRLVEYPEEINLAQFVIGPQKAAPLKYRLMGIIKHLGSTIAAGHYGAVVLNRFNDKWYAFNDHICHEATHDDVHSRSAYLLFYERQEDDDSKT